MESQSRSLLKQIHIFDTDEVGGLAQFGLENEGY